MPDDQMLYTCIWCIDEFKEGKRDMIPFWRRDKILFYSKSELTYVKDMHVSHGICKEHYEKEINKNG